MTFDELWVEIEKLQILPGAAIKQVPHVLSNETKNTTFQENSGRNNLILSDAIEQINHGSFEPVDASARKNYESEKEFHPSCLLIRQQTKS